MEYPLFAILSLCIIDMHIIKTGSIVEEWLYDIICQSQQRTAHATFLSSLFFFFNSTQGSSQQ